MGRSGSAYSLAPKERLRTFEQPTIDGLRVEGDQGRVLLAKRKGKWPLPEIADFPADPDAVTRLLDKLAETKKGWPVAARPSAARRLGVTSAGARALT